MLMTSMEIALGVVAFLLVAATLLPLIDTPAWWIRGLEFPRVQIAVLLAVVIVGGLVLRGWTGWLSAAAAAACLVWQLVYIWPYTPFGRTELREADASAEGDDVTFLASNVQMENKQYDAVAAEIRRADADVVLLMETDDGWVKAMEPALEGYPTVLKLPLDNHYGMVFATRLTVHKAELVELTTDETPTAFAELETPGGQKFRFIGLHPVPPIPGEDAELRDAQILYAARYAHNSGAPVIAMGDFNTVAWSQAAYRFKVGGGYRDPRIGRGPLPSFDATSWLMRFPIDQFYMTGDAVLLSYGRGPAVGSDHFPMHSRVRFDKVLAARLNREIKPIAAEEEDEIQRLIGKYEKRLIEHKAHRHEAEVETGPREGDPEVRREASRETSAG